MSLKIRAYRAEDRSAVRSICFETGFMGDSIAPLYDDRESFADMFTAYYTDREPESCFVVESDGAVVGYLLGCLDSRRTPSTSMVFARHVLLRALGLRPGTARFVWRGIFDAVTSPWQTLTQPDLARYPGHTHFSVLPPARQAPVAVGLFRAFFKYAKERGCPGVHGEVFAENERASALHLAMGFEKEGPAVAAPAMRTLGGERLHVQLWTRKL